MLSICEVALYAVQIEKLLAHFELPNITPMLFQIIDHSTLMSKN